MISLKSERSTLVLYIERLLYNFELFESIAEGCLRLGISWNRCSDCSAIFVLTVELPVYFWQIRRHLSPRRIDDEARPAHRNSLSSFIKQIQFSIIESSTRVFSKPCKIYIATALSVSPVSRPSITVFNQVNSLQVCSKL